MLRSMVVAAAAAGLIGSTIIVFDANAGPSSARAGAPTGGMRTGGPAFHANPGFRTGGPSFRTASPAFRGAFPAQGVRMANPSFRGTVGPAFRGPAFRSGFRFAGPGTRFHRFRHFRRFGFVGAPYFAYSPY